MKCPFSFLSSVSCLSAEIDEKAVLGMGGALAPTLQISVRLDLTYPFDGPGFLLELREIRCRLVVKNSYLSSRVCVAPHAIQVTAARRQLSDQLVQIEFPLDFERLTFMERQRVGGNMALRLEFDLQADQWRNLGQPASNGQLNGPWGLVAHHRGFHNVELEIPRSVWIERVLPNVGIGTIHLLELPVIPPERCAAFEPAVAALTRAHKLLIEGHWDEAVGKCRVALDPFFEQKEIKTDTGEIKKIPILKSSWETRLGKATYDWLNASLTAIKEPMNKTHHSPVSYFDQVSAQTILAITTGLVAYAARAVDLPTTG